MLLVRHGFSFLAHAFYGPLPTRCLFKTFTFFVLATTFDIVLFCVRDGFSSVCTEPTFRGAIKLLPEFASIEIGVLSLYVLSTLPLLLFHGLFCTSQVYPRFLFKVWVQSVPDISPVDWCTYLLLIETKYNKSSLSLIGQTKYPEIRCL